MSKQIDRCIKKFKKKDKIAGHISKITHDAVIMSITCKTLFTKKGREFFNDSDFYVLVMERIGYLNLPEHEVMREVNMARGKI